MRKIKPSFDFDLWIPKLAPSERLLRAYVIDKSMRWSEFSRLYAKQVFHKQRKIITTLVRLSQYTKITLLCWEKSARRCHRSLLLNECKRIADGNEKSLSIKRNLS